MTHRRAFTLVEAVVTMVILATVCAITTGVVVAAGREHSTAALRAELASRASHAMERVSETLRELAVTAGPALDASLISAQDVQWAGGGRLRLSAGALLLTAPGGVERTLTTGVSAFTITPLGDTGTPLATPVTGSAIADVQRFSVTLTLAESGLSSTLRTTVFPRRLAASPS